MKRDEGLSKQAYQQGWIKRSKSFCHKFNSAFAFWKFAAIHSSLVSKTQPVVPNYESWSGKRLRSSLSLKRRSVTSWSCWQISKVGLRTCIDSAMNGMEWTFVTEHCKPPREGDELSTQVVCKGCPGDLSWGVHCATSDVAASKDARKLVNTREYPEEVHNSTFSFQTSLWSQGCPMNWKSFA